MRTIRRKPIQVAAPATIRRSRSRRRLALLPVPARASNGYRLYTADAIDILRFIRQASGLGLSLREIKEILVIRRGGGGRGGLAGRPPPLHPRPPAPRRGGAGARTKARRSPRPARAASAESPGLAAADHGPGEDLPACRVVGASTDRGERLMPTPTHHLAADHSRSPGLRRRHVLGLPRAVGRDRAAGARDHAPPLHALEHALDLVTYALGGAATLAVLGLSLGVEPEALSSSSSSRRRSSS
jgi:DNA-binding transcriptional MerR regulator